MKSHFSLCWDKDKSTVAWYEEGLKLFVYKWSFGTGYKGYGVTRDPHVVIIIAENLWKANEIFFSHKSQHDFYEEHYRRDLYFSTHKITGELYFKPDLSSFWGEEIIQIENRPDQKNNE